MPDCSPDDLRVTLDGGSILSPGEANTFKLAAINTTKVTCVATVTDKNFELKITTGKGRVWSSKDCRKLLADFRKPLAPGARAGWQLTWNGKRSVKGKKCKVGKAAVHPGSYWATAKLTGSKAVQLPMLIT